MSDVRIGVIGGTGLGALLGDHVEPIARHRLTTPFDLPAGEIIEISVSGLSVFLLARHGPGHLLNPTQVPYRANLFAMKQLGVTHILASCAVGSLREELRPRDLVIADQIIDKTRRPATFFDHAAVHVEFADPFCPVLRNLLLAGASNVQTAVHRGGCYVAMEGPAFSTRAEAHMHRIWGGDVIGMTGMPEAKLAREAEIAYAMVALVTDYDCWRKPPADKASSDKAPAEKGGVSLTGEIIGNLQAASRSALALITATIETIAADPAAVAACPAHHALAEAIWSDKAQIDKETVDRLAPLWLKYFGKQDR